MAKQLLFIICPNIRFVPRDAAVGSTDPATGAHIVDAPLIGRYFSYIAACWLAKLFRVQNRACFCPRVDTDVYIGLNCVENYFLKYPPVCGLGLKLT